MSTKKYNSAQKACADKLPSFGAGGPNGQNAQDFQAYLSCLSDHGVKVPTSGGLRNLDPNDPTFQDANKTCGALLPQGVTPGDRTRMARPRLESTRSSSGRPLAFARTM